MTNTLGFEYNKDWIARHRIIFGEPPHEALKNVFEYTAFVSLAR